MNQFAIIRAAVRPELGRRNHLPRERLVVEVRRAGDDRKLRGRDRRREDDRGQDNNESHRTRRAKLNDRADELKRDPHENPR